MTELLDKDAVIARLAAAIEANGGTQKEFAEKHKLRQSLISTTLRGALPTPQILNVLGLEAAPRYREKVNHA